MSELRAGRITPKSSPTTPTSSKKEAAKQKSIDALRDGSYGIAACYVIQGHGQEITVYGANRVAQGDPHGHAEMMAARRARELLDRDDPDLDGSASKR